MMRKRRQQTLKAAFWTPEQDYSLRIATADSQRRLGQRLEHEIVVSAAPPSFRCGEIQAGDLDASTITSRSLSA